MIYPEAETLVVFLQLRRDAITPGDRRGNAE